MSVKLSVAYGGHTTFYAGHQMYYCVETAICYDCFTSNNANNAYSTPVSNAVH